MKPVFAWMCFATLVHGLSSVAQAQNTFNEISYATTPSNNDFFRLHEKCIKLESAQSYDKLLATKRRLCDTYKERGLNQFWAAVCHRNEVSRLENFNLLGPEDQCRARDAIAYLSNTPFYVGLNNRPEICDTLHKMLYAAGHGTTKCHARLAILVAEVDCAFGNCDRALKSLSAVMGPDTGLPDMARGYYLKAWILKLVGKKAESDAAFEAAVQHHKDLLRHPSGQLGLDVEGLAPGAGNMAEVLSACGQHLRAAERCDFEDQAVQQVYGAASEIRSAKQLDAGVAYLAGGSNATAVERALSALKHEREHGGSDLVHTIEIFLSSGAILHLTARHDQAREVFEEALTMCSNKAELRSMQARARLRLANLALAGDDIPEADRQSTEALKIADESEEPLLQIDALKVRAKVMAEMSDFEAAIVHITTAINSSVALTQADSPKGHPSTAELLRMRGAIFHRSGNSAAADADFKRGISILDATVGEQHPLSVQFETTVRVLEKGQ